MAITITPKVKIVTGVGLSGVGVLSLYQAYKAEKKNKLAFGIVGGLSLIGGLLLARKGYVQHKSLKVMPQEPDGNADKVKKIIQDAVKEGKVSGGIANASGDSAVLEPKKSVQKSPVQQNSRPVAKTPAPSQRPTPAPAPQQSAIKEEKQWQNGRVVGQVDLKRLEASKAMKEKLLKRIELLKVQHDKIKKEKGWNAGLPIRNEIEMTKAQLFWC